MGYFTAKEVEVIQQQQADNWSEQSDSFNMTVFPWLALTPTDRHVIMSTNSSLQSREPHLLVNSCDFLSDVVFQDFPAEIFLQRPNIVKNLLSILGSPSVSNTQLIVHASRTLGDLASCLKSRIKYYQDPALYTPKQDAGSSSGSQFSSSPSAESNQSAHSDARQSLIGWTDTRHRGDGRDGDSSTSSSRTSLASSIGLGGPDATTTREETDLEDMPTLQYSQMSLPQFCTQVLQKSLPLLKTGEEEVVVQLLYLLDQILGILGSVVTPNVWQDTSSNAREIVERLTESFGIISELIVFHHHSNRNLGNEKGDLVQHRLALIGVAGILSRILKQLVPFQMVRGILPDSLTGTINLLVFDEGLSHSYPDVQIILLAYLQQIDHVKYQTYTDTAQISQSMQKSCKFLMLCQEEAYKGSSELILLAESAIQSLPYHQHLTLVTEFVKLSSSICARTMDSDDLRTKCKNVLLKFLAHPLSNVRQQSYNTIYQVIKGSLSVSEASDPSSRACFLSRFIFDTEVLYEMIVFGLSDKDKKVSSAANLLIHHVLESQLLMTSELWQEFLTCLLKTLSVLQSYADIDSDLGQTILSMLEPQNKSDTGVLPHLEKLRGTLRLMFCSDVRTRAEALKRLAWFLSNEENSNNKLPVFSSLDVTNLTNIFVMETPRSVDEDLGRSVFQIDGLRKVFEIFTSTSVDPSVKKSAVDQLAIILQDHNLHTAFKNEGGLEKIMDHIELGIQKQENTQANEYLQYLPACVTILRYLIHYDYTLRHKLAYETQIYINLLRVAFLHQKEQRVCYDVAHIFTLLLFDEVAKFDLGGGLNPVVHFSVPLILTKRYRLPFRPSCHHDNSVHVTALPTDPDSLQTGPPSEMLRVIWNVAWHGSMDKLLDHLKKQKGQNEAFSEFSTKLKLTVTDRVLLQCSHLKRGIQQAVYDISNATSHKHVSASLKRLLSYLVVSTGCHGTDLFFGMDWFPAVGRFLKVTPSSTPDESLLHEVLSFICMTLRLTNQVPDKTLQLLGEVLYQPSGPLIGLLHRASVQGEPRDVPENVNIKRSLDKELLSFIATYNSKLPYLLCRRLKFHQLRGDLSHQLLLRLNVTDAPHFYNLASLEGTLQCLMHITARPGWSSESSEIENITLCSQLLTSLLEVVSAFHIGRGGTSMSYMGKGVTKAATLCLRHLAYEMATVNEDKDWPRQWCYQQQKTDSTEAELNWMLTLWAYRDPEAALLLVNLTSQTMPVGSVELEQNVWQGPVVTDTEFEVSLVGLTALLALIHHSQFYQEMLILISNFYAQPSIYPVMVDFPRQQLSNTATDYTFSTVGIKG
ncbi:hypothetical protein KUTeg_019416 [Tegillarca granosa]|uniref:Uncharacterized protein n=1 Tax=Tegillarca granosa TaxID=220873 RepID=A0ABQ9ECX7_TEGGR|nr:hypothetical protein KUTeg_019416 [Tegillarca granosa]